MRRILAVSAALLLALALAGCSKQQNTADTMSQSSDSLLASNPVEQPAGDLTPAVQLRGTEVDAGRDAEAGDEADEEADQPAGDVDAANPARSARRQRCPGRRRHGSKRGGEHADHDRDRERRRHVDR